MKVDGGEGGTVDPTNNPDGSLGAPICAAYGGYENVKTISGAVLAKVSADCRISSPIAQLDAKSAQHLKECFEIQMGSAFQCPGVTYVSNTTKDSQGTPCRDMTQAHKGMNLRKADFDAFRDDLAASLGESKLTPADVKSIAAFVEGTRNLVTQNNTQPDKNTFCACPNGEYPAGSGKSCVVDAGTDAGSDAADAADADGG
ncbi:MAG TPA: hypothetical protein VLT33_00930 [Labilithrix sp.]|nr:hypothetical protein [Labilithrix sp.]